MAKEETLTPLDAFFRFLAKLPERDLCWMAIGCSFEIDDDVPEIRTAGEANKWFHGYLESTTRPEQLFGRLIHLIAILDFQLSPLAISRMAARAEWMTQSKSDFVATEGRRMLQETVPRLTDMVSAFRMHELDQASLWVYRDELKRQGWEEIGKQLGFL